MAGEKKSAATSEVAHIGVAGVLAKLVGASAVLVVALFANSLQKQA